MKFYLIVVLGVMLFSIVTGQRVLKNHRPYSSNKQNPTSDFSANSESLEYNGSASAEGESTSYSASGKPEGLDGKTEVFRGNHKQGNSEGLDGKSAGNILRGHQTKYQGLDGASGRERYSLASYEAHKGKESSPNFKAYYAPENAGSRGSNSGSYRNPANSVAVESIPANGKNGGNIPHHLRSQSSAQPNHKFTQQPTSAAVRRAAPQRHRPYATPVAQSSELSLKNNRSPSYGSDADEYNTSVEDGYSSSGASYSGPSSYEVGQGGYSSDGGSSGEYRQDYSGYDEPIEHRHFGSENSYESGYHYPEKKHVKTITVTKEVPVPYPVQVEKKVPYPVKVPVERPVPYPVEKPYPVKVEKEVPYPVKVNVPQPYPVEKPVHVPVKVYVDKPVPVKVEKPYPVIVEKRVPYPVEKKIHYAVKVPVERPVPVKIPVYKTVPVPVEKEVRYEVKIPYERPVPVHVDKPVPVHVVKNVPYPVTKQIPYPIKVPVKIPVPYEVIKHVPVHIPAKGEQHYEDDGGEGDHYGHHADHYDRH